MYDQRPSQELREALRHSPNTAFDKMGQLLDAMEDRMNERMSALEARQDQLERASRNIESDILGSTTGV